MEPEQREEHPERTQSLLQVWVDGRGQNKYVVSPHLLGRRASTQLEPKEVPGEVQRSGKRRGSLTGNTLPRAAS